DFKPAPRPERVGDEHSERAQDCNHRLSCNDSASRCESRLGCNFRKGQVRRSGNVVEGLDGSTTWHRSRTCSRGEPSSGRCCLPGSGRGTAGEATEGGLMPNPFSDFWEFLIGHTNERTSVKQSD